MREDTFGVAAYKTQGTIMRDDTLADIMAADAVLFGCAGGPGYDEIPFAVRHAGNLPRLRRPSMKQKR